MPRIRPFIKSLYLKERPLGSRFRYAELDGLRGIALFMVLGWHYFYGGVLLIGLPEYLTSFLNLGVSGLDLFFVLSGFLLGGILLDNKEASNYFKVFYTRRVCRIFPLYFLVVIPLLIAPLPLVNGWHDPFFGKPLPSWTYITYTQNIAIALQGNYGSGWLAHTWSLAVEEQFYLVLPFLIWFVSRKRLPYLLVGLILAAPLSRMALLPFHPYGNFAFWWFLLPCRADPLLLGVLGAWAVRDERWLNLLRTHTRVLYGVLAVLAGGALLLPGRDPTQLTELFPPTYGFTWLGLLYSCVLLIAVTEKRGLITFVTRNRLLGGIGLISYATYMLHMPIRGFIYWLVLGRAPFDPIQTWSDALVTLGALLLTLTLASISWIFFEKRLVNLGRSFKYEKARA